MYHLTANAHPVYSSLTGAKSPVGSHTPINQEAFSRSNVIAAFFASVFNWHDKSPRLWVLHGAEPAQAGEGRYLLGAGKLANGGVNSVRYPPYSIHTEMLGNQNLTKKVSIMAQKITAFMPEDCFAFNPNVDTSKLYDPIYIALNRAQALLSLIQRDGEDMAEGFTLPHSALMYALDGVDADIKQAQQLIDLWLSAPADGTEAGEAN